jgi:hypothetical protein
MPNHLMEAMALVLLEQPARRAAGSFARSAGRGPARGGHPGGGDDAQPDRPRPPHRGHDRDPPGSLPRRRTRGRPRNTETCACLTLQVNSPRRAGVPFTPRSGKPWRPTQPRSPSTSPPARHLPGQRPGVEPNILTAGPDRTLHAAAHHAQPPRTHRRDPATPGTPGTATVHRLRRSPARCRSPVGGRTALPGEPA